MSSDDRLYLLTFAVRGHRLAPWPTGVELPRQPRQEPPPSRDHRRYLRPEHYPLVRTVIANRCQMRSGELLDIEIRPSHVHAIVRLPWGTSMIGLVCAVRLVTTRRLQREAQWARDESVYTRRVRDERLTDAEAASIGETLRRRS